MEAPSQEPPVSPAKWPWLTWLTGAVCLIVFAGLRLRGADLSEADFARWGAPSAQAIWHGAYWALVTSVLVHLAVWHIAFNLYWLWVFGRVLEHALGATGWIALFLSAAIVSSGAELAATGATGIGLSGVIYAFFGFLWVSRPARPAFAAVVPRQTVNLFLGWLIFCVFATRLGILTVANAAHAGGLVFGLASGWAFVRAPRAILPKAVVAALLGGALVPLFWCPWQFSWVAMKAYDAHKRGEYQTAVGWYLRAQSFEEEPAWVLENLALAYANLEDTESYVATMEKLRRLDPAAARYVEGGEPTAPIATPSPTPPP